MMPAPRNTAYPIGSRGLWIFRPSALGAMLAFASIALHAQSPLLMVCPQPPKNSPATCTLSIVGPSSVQWNLTTSPTVSGVTAKPLVTGKNLGLGTNGLMMLFGMNSTPLAGNIATVTIPRHNGALVVKLSNIVASDAAGHAVAVAPAVSVTVN